MLNRLRPNYMDGFAVSRMRWVTHTLGVLANPTLEVLALSVVLSDVKTAVENFKA